jgi:hypothetical protein
VSRQLIILFLGILFFTKALAQPQFSLSTDLSLQKSFKKGQQYWAVGNSNILNFHLTPKDGIYAWFCYFSDGKFHNNITAIAKNALTSPSQINYRNSVRMRLKQISIGWKRYLKGTPDAEKNWNLYGSAGFGLLFGRVTNIHTVNIDTALYNVPVLSGTANFKRLTFDLGLGIEFPLGGDFFIYSEARAFIPATGYPSPYIFVNDNAPFVSNLSLGLRLLF